MAIKEADVMRLIQMAVSKIGARVFRNNTGLGWVGKSIHFSKTQMVQVNQGDVLIRQARPLHAGLCEGSSDLIGWYDKRFTAIEVKGELGVLKPDQVNFIEQVNKSGGIAFVARTPEEALLCLKNSTSRE